MFVGFLAYTLGPALVGLRTLLSVDILSSLYPWIARDGNRLYGHNACSGDTIDAVIPGIARVRAQVFSAHFSGWQGLVGGGSPLASQPDLGLLSPLALPYWIMPLWLAPAFVALLQIVVAAGGTFLFLRQFRVGRAAAILAGLVFATSGFIVMWTNWPQSRVAALIPVLFWAVERLVRRHRLRDSGLVAVAVAFMILGGFPAVTGWALEAATVYLFVRLWALYRADLRRAARIVVLSVVGLVIGGLMSAVQALPFLYFYRSADLGYRSGESAAGLPLSGLTTLFAPNSYGLCVGGQADYGPVNPVELVAYIGSAALVLAVIGAAWGLHRRGPGRRGLRGFAVGLVVVIVVLGWASPTARSAVSSLPPFAGNYIGRIRSVLGFGLAVLVGIGFDRLLGLDAPPARAGDPGPTDTAGGTDTAARTDTAGPAARRLWPASRLLWPAVVVLGTLAAGLVVLRAAHRQAFTGGYATELRHALVVPAVLIGVAAVAAAVGRWGPVPARVVALAVIPVLVAVQAAQFFHTVLPGDNPAYFYPDTPTHRFLAAHLGEDRFSSAQRDMYTATALYYGLRTPTGHTFQEPAWEDLLRAVDPKVMNTPTFSDFTSAIDQANIAHQPILDAMAVRYFVLGPSQLAGRYTPVPPGTGPVPAGPSGTESCAVPGGPLRGVSFRLAGPLRPLRAGGGVTVSVVARHGSTTLRSGDYIFGAAAAGQVVSVALAGEGLAGTAPTQVTVTASGSGQPLVLEGSGRSALCSPVLPADDGLRLVFADAGSIVYQRLSSLPRVRWEPRSVVATSPQRQVSMMAAGLPAGTVVLDRPGPAATGAPATVSVLDDSNGSVRARVDARGGGYLLVADAVQQRGWSVRVDGRTAALVPADHAMGAVFVPAGIHTVSFAYRAPGQVAGAALSVVGVVLLLFVVVGTEVPGRRRRQRDPEPPDAGPADSTVATGVEAGAGRATSLRTRRETPP